MSPRDKKSNTAPRQHHIVSRVYIEGFCKSGTDRVAILDLQNGKIRCQRPAKILRRRDYFRQKHAPPGKDEFVIEKETSRRIESQLKQIINKVIAGGHGLTQDELITFTRHLELQWLSVPKQANFAKSIAKDFVENIAYAIPGVDEELRKGSLKIDIKDEFRFNFLHDMIKSGEFFTHISRMIWNVWDSPKEYIFVSSDNPVSIFNPRAFPPNVAGIGLIGSVLLFPLTPKHCLELIHPEHETEKYPDFLKPIKIKPFDVSGVRIRAGRTMSYEKAYAVNNMIGLCADRYIFGSRIDVLADVHEFLKKVRPKQMDKEP
jgi:hypothetical protein